MATPVRDLGATAPPSPRGQPPRPRRTVRVISCVVIVLLLLELVARVLEPRLLPAARWNHALSGGHLQNIERLAAAGGVDILVVGSSTVGSDVDARQLAAEVDLPRGAYNLWMSGPSMQSIELLTSRWALPALSPSVLVIGVTSRELNDAGESQREHVEVLRGSPAGRRLLAGDHPLRRLEQAISDVSALVRTRQELRQPHRVLAALQGASDGSTIDSRGMDVGKLDRALEILPEHVEQEQAALRPFAVGGAELASLARLVSDARGRGIEVVLIDMPVLEAAYVPYHERGRADDERYQEVLASFARAQEVELVQARDLTWDEDLFADENHLNGDGARRLTGLLGRALD